MGKDKKTLKLKIYDGDGKHIQTNFYYGYKFNTMAEMTDDYVSFKSSFGINPTIWGYDQTQKKWVRLHDFDYPKSTAKNITDYLSEYRVSGDNLLDKFKVTNC